MTGFHPLDQNTSKGILFLLLATLAFTAMDACAKALIQTYPAPQVVWARFLGQALLVTAFIAVSRRQAELRTAHPWHHLARSALQLGATTFFFLSLGHIGLAEATAIADIAPVLITLGAALFLGEKLGTQRIVAVIVALIGALIIIRPGSDVFSPAAILPLLCAASYAGNTLYTRLLGLREGPLGSMFYAAWFGVAAMGSVMPFVWVPVALDDLPIFVLIGFLGTAAQFLIIRALAIAEASAVAPLTYFGILFASIWGFVFFDEIPSFWTGVGALVIVAAGLYVWHSETRTRRG